MVRTPGHRPDADMLEVGNAGLTAAEQRSQVGMLAVLGLPLLIGTDLSAASPGTVALLGSPGLAQLDASPAVPRRLTDAAGVHVWRRDTADGAVLALWNPTDAPVAPRVAGSEGASVLLGAWGPGLTVAPHDVLLLRLAGPAA